MAWSKQTLKQLAPVLAAGQVAFHAKQEVIELPKTLINAVTSARKAFIRGTAGLPHPNAIGTLPIYGKVTGTQILLKLYA